MNKTKRSYLIPTKLSDAFKKQCRTAGYVRERVVAASICHFLKSDPDARAAMFDDLDKFLKRKKG